MSEFKKSATIALNLEKQDNYAFYCPISQLHLTITNPVEKTDRVSISVIRGLIAGSLIDVDGVVDIDRVIGLATTGQEITEEIFNSTDVVEIIDVEDVEDVEEVIDVEEEKPKKKAPKKAKPKKGSKE